MEEKTKKKDSVVRDAAILTVITLVAGILLGLVHSVTAGPIAAEAQKNLENAQHEVFEAADRFEDAGLSADELQKIVDDGGISKTEIVSVYRALDASGNVLGYVVDTTNSEGYGGDVELLTGITAENGECTINGISFLELSETAGMGMKAQNPEFKDQFNGLKANQITVGEDSDAVKIDAVSGATITSKAVCKDINAALLAAQYMEAQK